MLSPHEFATLMLVREMPDRDDLNPADLDALLEYQLVAPDKLTSRGRYLNLTDQGYLFLSAAAGSTKSTVALVVTHSTELQAASRGPCASGFHESNVDRD